MCVGVLLFPMYCNLYFDSHSDSRRAYYIIYMKQVYWGWGYQNYDHSVSLILKVGSWD